MLSQRGGNHAVFESCKLDPHIKPESAGSVCKLPVSNDQNFFKCTETQDQIYHKPFRRCNLESKDQNKRCIYDMNKNLKIPDQILQKDYSKNIMDSFHFEKLYNNTPKTIEIIIQIDLEKKKLPENRRHEQKNKENLQSELFNLSIFILRFTPIPNQIESTSILADQAVESALEPQANLASSTEETRSDNSPNLLIFLICLIAFSKFKEICSSCNYLECCLELVEQTTEKWKACLETLKYSHANNQISFEVTQTKATALGEQILIDTNAIIEKIIKTLKKSEELFQLQQAEIKKKERLIEQLNREHEREKNNIIEVTEKEIQQIEQLCEKKIEVWRKAARDLADEHLQDVQDLYLKYRKEIEELKEKLRSYELIGQNQQPNNCRLEALSRTASVH